MEAPFKIKQVIEAHKKNIRHILILFEDGSLVTCKNQPELECYFIFEDAKQTFETGKKMLKHNGYEIKETWKKEKIKS